MNIIIIRIYKEILERNRLYIYATLKRTYAQKEVTHFKTFRRGYFFSSLLLKKQLSFPLRSNKRKPVDKCERIACNALYHVTRIHFTYIHKATIGVKASSNIPLSRLLHEEHEAYQ
jgi:hypothetical protein